MSECSALGARGTGANETRAVARSAAHGLQMGSFAQSPDMMIDPFHDDAVCYYIFSVQSPVPMTTIHPPPADVRRSVLVLDERLGRQHVRLDHLADERVEVDLAPPAELRLRLGRVPEEQPGDP
jgi:hypothetical protein